MYVQIMPLALGSAVDVLQTSVSFKSIQSVIYKLSWSKDGFIHIMARLEAQSASAPDLCKVNVLTDQIASQLPQR